MCFLVAMCHLKVRTPNLKIATKCFLHQKVKILGQFQCHVVHGSVPLKLFPVVWIFLRSLGLICYNRWVLNEGHKNCFNDQCLMKSQATFLILTSNFNSMKWPYYPKVANHTALNHIQLSKTQPYQYLRSPFKFSWMRIFH